MNSHKTATQARPELRISMLPGERCSPGVLPAMRAYIKRAYEGHYKIVWTEDNPHLYSSRQDSQYPREEPF